MFNLCYTPSNCNITENKKTCMLLIHASLDARAQMADNSRRRYKTDDGQSLEGRPSGVLGRIPDFLQR